MSKNIFDEMQYSIGNKFGMHAFCMTFFITLINAIVKNQFLGCNYATPLNEWIMVMFIPFTYFSVACILNNSHLLFSNNRKLNRIVLIDLVITTVFLAVFMSYNNCFADIFKNGLHSDWLSCLLLSIYGFILLAVYIFRMRKNTSEEI